MKRVLMLDVDGVLVHSHNGGSWAADIERDLGIDPDRLSAEFFATHWPDVILGRKHLHAALDDCLPELSETLTAQEFIDYWFSRDSMIDEAVLADARALKGEGFAIYLATNQEHQRARYLMEAMGLAADVDGIIYSAAIGEKKPRPGFFAAAERVSGFTGEQCVFIDDQLGNIEAARAFGWHPLHWTGRQDLISLVNTAAQQGW
ncbi:HAD family hydrolase [Martelella endophytica]|uniref:Haloacid dehalogenase n=1 Tax=Martelella endophytica TaxID=1486262 RepID=A0A0D5LJT0_MAREN|nr:HAD-IA family hydrolase [Martelella endophytica]AJY44444.1 haloacid dehalogenase [Martelella endophytica]